MQTLIDVILPVFLVIGFGIAARRWLGLGAASADALMQFATHFGFPVLLFRGISRLDLGQSFDVPMLAAFYTGVISGFLAGLLGARFLFRRAWPDSVAVAFVAAFSNGGILGLPITERAYGTDALGYNFAIIAFHAPFVYLISITAMEFVRAEGRSIGATVLSVARSMARNPLLIGILLGAAVNLSGLPLPAPVVSAVDLVADSAIPIALLALGAVIANYRPEGDVRLVLWAVGISLFLHPVLVLTLGSALNLSQGAIRSSVLMAAMAPGLNGYVFASMYGVAKRVAATSVLVGTVLSIGTVWLWLQVLP